MFVSRAVRSALPVALAALLAGGIVSAAPASSAEEDTLDCTGKNDVGLAPGIGTTATNQASFQSTAPGVLECEGSINGKKATGPGQYATSGQFNKDATCSIGGGKGLLKMVVATVDGGIEQISTPFTFEYPVLPVGGGPMGGKLTFDNPDYGGKFSFTPIKGDCVQTPVTAIRVKDIFDFVS
ncbi:MAG: hypothetical protein ACT4QG_20095 [Sporichthyaceae bacterium]